MPPRKKHREACKFKRIHLNGFFCGTAFIQQGCHKHKTVTHAQFCFFHSLHPGWLTSRWKLGTEASHIADKKPGRDKGLDRVAHTNCSFRSWEKWGQKRNGPPIASLPIFSCPSRAERHTKRDRKEAFSRARFCHFFVLTPHRRMRPERISGTVSG